MLKMKIEDLITSVADLVRERKIIKHGDIRKLYSAQDAREIACLQKCTTVGIGTIGDNDLADSLDEMVELEEYGRTHLENLVKLAAAYRGGAVEDYCSPCEKDELRKLDALIAAARDI